MDLLKQIKLSVHHSRLLSVSDLMFYLQQYSLNACDHLTSQSVFDMLLQAALDFGAMEWLVSQQVMF